MLGAGMGADSVALADKPHIVAQLCLPKASAESPYSLPLDEIGLNSINSVWGRQAGLTTAGQSVFEAYLGERGYARYLVFTGRKPPSMVFVIPARVSPDSWTEWRAADFQSAHPELQFVLLSDQRVGDRDAPPDDAPRIRYQVLPFEQYLERSGARNGGERDIPAC